MTRVSARERDSEYKEMMDDRIADFIQIIKDD